MDINGTRFHLYKSSRDWARCRLVGQPPEVGDWYAFSLVDHDPDWLHVAWDASSGLTLSPQLAFFPRGRRAVPLDAGEPARCGRRRLRQLVLDQPRRATYLLGTVRHRPTSRLLGTGPAADPQAERSLWSNRTHVDHAPIRSAGWL